MTMKIVISTQAQSSTVSVESEIPECLTGVCYFQYRSYNSTGVLLAVAFVDFRCARFVPAINMLRLHMLIVVSRAPNF